MNSFYVNRTTRRKYRGYPIRKAATFRAHRWQQRRVRLLDGAVMLVSWLVILAGCGAAWYGVWALVRSLFFA